MTNKDFEAGIRFKTLTDQIDQIETLIENSKKKEELKKTFEPILKDVFNEWYNLATKYNLASSKIKRTSEIYQRYR